MSLSSAARILSPTVPCPKCNATGRDAMTERDEEDDRRAHGAYTREIVATCYGCYGTGQVERSYAQSYFAQVVAESVAFRRIQASDAMQLQDPDGGEWLEEQFAEWGSEMHFSGMVGASRSHWQQDRSQALANRLTEEYAAMTREEFIPVYRAWKAGTLA
jgi:hypothetical protein